MKKHPLLLATIFAAVSICLIGCNNPPAKVDATGALDQSFQQATPEVKQAIQSVNTSLRAGNYVGAINAMNPIIRGALTDAQKKAIGLELQQINQAIAANPSLDSAEFYKQRQELFNRVYSAPKL